MEATFFIYEQNFLIYEIFFIKSVSFVITVAVMGHRRLLVYNVLISVRNQIQELNTSIHFLCLIHHK